MAGGSTRSTSPPGASNGAFSHASLGSSSSSSSPPKLAFSQAMSAEAFASTNPLSHSYNKFAKSNDRKTLDASNSLSLLSLSDADSSPDVRSIPTIFMRKLPGSTSEEALRSMFLFAKDLIGAELIAPTTHEDKGFFSAVAQFRTLAGAEEARDMLNGKPNAAGDANMIVELVKDQMPGTIGTRRNTLDVNAGRQGSSSTMSGASTNGQSSKFHGTFQSLEKMLPPSNTPGLGNNDFPPPESMHLQSIFSPTSPVGTSFTHRNLGKNVIEDEEDADTQGLIDSIGGYGNGGAGPAVQTSLNRRPTNPNALGPRFANLTLTTNTPTLNGAGISSPPVSSFMSPRSALPMQSPGGPVSAMSPMNGMTGPNSAYGSFAPHFPRPTYPPVNPADQNPPCNTLYVGNLPLDTSEDELKAMFSKQRGYKRLCFRTKQNGPMCFVEFEDVSFATKALNDLYGQPLHNSVKGGIRLSFSKNPLGVRTGQNNSLASPTALTPQSAMPGLNGLTAPVGFSTATGPPPGIPTPPHMHMNNGNNNPTSAGGFGMYSSGNYNGNSNDIHSPMRVQPLSGIPTSVAGNGFHGMASGFPYMVSR